MTFDEQRERMVETQLKARGLTDERLLAAFLKVPRHLFVPMEVRPDAYADHPLPIASGQTISQPYIVALMTDALRLRGHERVLEIGTGSGYQTAILAEMALEVFSVERLPEFLPAAARRFNELGYLNIHLSAGNGTLYGAAVASTTELMGNSQVHYDLALNNGVLGSSYAVSLIEWNR